MGEEPTVAHRGPRITTYTFGRNGTFDIHGEVHLQPHRLHSLISIHRLGSLGTEARRAVTDGTALAWE